MRGLFVTGTDTGVGKTVVSAALAIRTGFRYWKPIQTGPDDDAAEVRTLAGCETLPNKYRFPDPVSPHLAARRCGENIDLLRTTSQAESLCHKCIVEGAGGVLVPIND